MCPTSADWIWTCSECLWSIWLYISITLYFHVQNQQWELNDYVNKLWLRLTKVWKFKIVSDRYEVNLQVHKDKFRAPTFESEIIGKIIFIFLLLLLLLLAGVGRRGVLVEGVAAGHRGAAAAAAGGAPPLPQTGEVLHRELQQVRGPLPQHLQRVSLQQVGQTRRNLHAHPGALHGLLSEHQPDSCCSPDTNQTSNTFQKHHTPGVCASNRLVLSKMPRQMTVFTGIFPVGRTIDSWRIDSVHRSGKYWLSWKNFTTASRWFTPFMLNNFNHHIYLKRDC